MWTLLDRMPGSWAPRLLVGAVVACLPVGSAAADSHAVWGLGAICVETTRGSKHGSLPGEGSPAAGEYRPPTLGAPVTRVVGGSREARADAGPAIVALAPPSTGLVGSPTPTLYWYLAEAKADAEVELTLVDAETLETLGEVLHRGSLTKGVHSFSLGLHGIVLPVDKTFQWNVALITDRENRSRDSVSTATVRHSPLSETASNASTAALDERLPALVKQDYWYDALDLLVRSLERHPGDLSGDDCRRWTAILRVVGLDRLADNGRY